MTQFCTQFDHFQFDHFQFDNVQVDNIQVNNIQVDNIQVDNIQVDNIQFNTFQFDDLFPELHELIFSYINYTGSRSLNKYYKMIADKIEINNKNPIIVSKLKFIKYLKTYPRYIHCSVSKYGTIFHCMKYSKEGYDLYHPCDTKYEIMNRICYYISDIIDNIESWSILVPGITSIIDLIIKHPLSYNKDFVIHKITSTFLYYMNFFNLHTDKSNLLKYLKGCCSLLNIQSQITNDEVDHLKELILNKISAI